MPDLQEIPNRTPSSNNVFISSNTSKFLHFSTMTSDHFVMILRIINY